MLIGAEKIFKTEGEYPLEVKFREMEGNEFSKYSLEKREFAQRGRKMDVVDHSEEVRCAWFEKLYIEIKGYYLNGKKEPVEYVYSNPSLESDKPIPKEELERIAKILRLDPKKIKSGLDLIPAKFKNDAIMYLFDIVDAEAADELKKN